MPANAPRSAPVPPDSMKVGSFISSIAFLTSSSLMVSTMSSFSSPLDNSSRSLPMNCMSSLASSSFPTCTNVIVRVLAFSSCDARCWSCSMTASLSSGWPAVITSIEQGLSSKPRSNASSSASVSALVMLQGPPGSCAVTISLMARVFLTCVYLSTPSPSAPGKQYTSRPSESNLATAFAMQFNAVTPLSQRVVGSLALGGGGGSGVGNS
mmetsp:Transcript_81851/g.226846  ORF Transcript_81851/g.226846 Transcript_81851/m.226846 type:complete len:210 (+) Transcript_81851:668-1297(+)